MPPFSNIYNVYPSLSYSSHEYEEKKEIKDICESCEKPSKCVLIEGRMKCAECIQNYIKILIGKADNYHSMIGDAYNIGFYDGKKSVTKNVIPPVESPLPIEKPVKKTEKKSELAVGTRWDLDFKD